VRMSIQKLDSRHEVILQQIEAFKGLNAQYIGVLLSLPLNPVKVERPRFNVYIVSARSRYHISRYVLETAYLFRLKNCIAI
jgi:hypothetical protein